MANDDDDRGENNEERKNSVSYDGNYLGRSNNGNFVCE